MRDVANMDTGRQKQHDWAWWIFPTDLEGKSEPDPKSKITTGTILLLFSNSNFMSIHALLYDTLSKTSQKIYNLFPTIDHDRIVYFWRQFKTIYIPTENSDINYWFTVYLHILEQQLPKLS